MSIAKTLHDDIRPATEEGITHSEERSDVDSVFDEQILDIIDKEISMHERVRDPGKTKIERGKSRDDTETKRKTVIEI